MFLPVHFNLSYIFNVGSALGIIFTVQVMSGILLSFGFRRGSPFQSVTIITKEVFFGCLFRWVHINFASLIFLFLFIHILRNLYFRRFQLKGPWISGLFILLIIIIIAFLGYTLPYGRIRYYGGMVITNFLSSFPFIGRLLPIWVWGDFIISRRTISFFFSLHFMFPFIVFVIILIHIILLHKTGSSSPNALHSSKVKIKFHPYYTIKDIINLRLIVFSVLFMAYYPYYSVEVDNFLEANPIVSPLHIKPEWYFLPFYAILRSVERKGGGIILIMLSVIIFFILPFKSSLTKNSILKQLVVFLFVMVFIVLSFVGGIRVEYPYTIVGKIFTIIYFLLLLLI